MRSVMSTERVDVLVVGLGPAGACAAAAAASAGKSVLAIDRKRRAGRPVQCAEFIPALLTQELENLDAVTHQAITRMITIVEANKDGPPAPVPNRHERALERCTTDGVGAGQSVEQAHRHRVFTNQRLVALFAVGYTRGRRGVR